jgi:hypothetical protein
LQIVVENSFGSQRGLHQVINLRRQFLRRFRIAREDGDSAVPVG